MYLTMKILGKTQGMYVLDNKNTGKKHKVCMNLTIKILGKMLGLYFGIINFVFIFLKQEFLWFH